MRRIYVAWSLSLALLALVVGAVRADPPSTGPVGWRTDGTGLYPNAHIGLKWAAGTPGQGIAWSVKLDSWSNAIPVVLGDRIITSAEPDEVICLSAADGAVLWRQPAGYEQAAVPVPGKRAPTQKTNGFTSPTPASDGKLVVTFNGFGIAACWDLQGKRQWIKYLATPANQYGSSASVAIAGNQAIIHVRDVVYALDIATGKQTWQSPSPSRWGSPVVARVGDRLLIVTAGGDFIDSADGKALARHVADLNYNAPVVSDGVVYFMCGEQGCKAIKLPDKIVDGWKPQVLWSSQVNKSNRTYSSPVVWDGMVYLLTQTSRLSAFDAKTGALAWEEDLKLGPTAYPSLLIAGKFLLASSDTGKTAVLEPGRSYKELGRNALDPFRSTPVIVDDKMYVRTRAGMVCIKGEE